MTAAITITAYRDNSGAILLYDPTGDRHCVWPEDGEMLDAMRDMADGNADDFVVDWHPGDPGDARWDAEGREVSEPPVVAIYAFIKPARATL